MSEGKRGESRGLPNVSGERVLPWRQRPAGAGMVARRAGVYVSGSIEHEREQTKQTTSRSTSGPPPYTVPPPGRVER